MNDFQFLHTSFEQDQNKTGTSRNEKLPDIYLVEDDRVLGTTIKKYLEKKLALNVHFFLTPTECLLELDKKIKSETVVNQTPFCLITDISFEVGGSDGLLLIDLLKERGHQFVSIVMTGFASIETAINATKKGVFHYLTKPFELEILSELVTKAFTRKLNIPESAFTSSEAFIAKTNISSGGNSSTTNTPHVFQNKFKIEAPGADDIFCGMVGRSKQMKQVFERIKKVASSDSTVFISGPSGTGKELVANALHNLSPRKSHNMVSVNCGAIPSELLESELFGHEKGAFTGAISSRKGRFEMAHRGSIFLDEIGDMPLLLQVKILRVLQNRVIERVGSTETTEIDVRIITATHRNLEEAVQAGNFREDLYYRLNVIPIKIPALKERREDIPLMISYFLSKFVSADLRNNIEFEDEALELLIGYDWPGNVRELENLIERLVILKGGSFIKVSDLPAKFLKANPQHLDTYKSLINLPEEGVDLKQLLSDIEDSLINQALEVTGGNKNQASKLLTMNRTTLIEKMKKKGFLQLN
ncbi:MAG: sigma-54 dependent transcriptional regulator [Bacteriovorax sp.]